MRIAMAAIVVACGGPAPRPVPVAAPKPAPVAIAPTTCADAGVVLRGPIDNEEDQAAGASREAAIANACEQGKWTAPVLDCIANKVDAQSCLDQLTDEQHEAYDAKVTAWAEQFAGSGDTPDDGGGAWVDCDDGINDVALYPPQIDLAGDDRTFAVTMRRREIMRQCTDQGWELEAKQCLQAATNGTAIADCTSSKLTAPQLTLLATRLGELDELVTTTFERRKKAPDCKQLVAAHYAEARWKGKLVEQKPAVRRKAIADSRVQMQKACVAEAWTPTVRACVAAGGADRCFDSYPWDFPATGVLAESSGIAACDIAATLLGRVHGCAKLDPTTREQLEGSLPSLRAKVAKDAPAEMVKLRAESCKAESDALLQLLQGVGC